MTIIMTAAAAYLLGQGIGSGTLDRWIDPGVHRPLLVVSFFLGATMAWMMAGAFIGMVYSAAELGEGPPAAGAANAWFALGITVVAIMPLPILVAVAWRQWWLWCLLSAAFAALFGWAMPYLAAR